jgi:hypothetical protein
MTFSQGFLDWRWATERGETFRYCAKQVGNWKCYFFLHIDNHFIPGLFQRETKLSVKVA